jgi:hypothetical protein
MSDTESEGRVEDVAIEEEEETTTTTTTTTTVRDGPVTRYQKRREQQQQQQEHHQEQEQQQQQEQHQEQEQQQHQEQEQRTRVLITDGRGMPGKWQTAIEGLAFPDSVPALPKRKGWADARSRAHAGYMAVMEIIHGLITQGLEANPTAFANDPLTCPFNDKLQLAIKEISDSVNLSTTLELMSRMDCMAIMSRESMLDVLDAIRESGFIPFGACPVVALQGMTIGSVDFEGVHCATIKIETLDKDKQALIKEFMDRNTEVGIFASKGKLKSTLSNGNGLTVLGACLLTCAEIEPDDMLFQGMIRNKINTSVFRDAIARLPMSHFGRLFHNVEFSEEAHSFFVGITKTMQKKFKMTTIGQFAYCRDNVLARILPDTVMEEIYRCLWAVRNVLGIPMYGGCDKNIIDKLPSSYMTMACLEGFYELSLSSPLIFTPFLIQDGKFCNIWELINAVDMSYSLQLACLHGKYFPIFTFLENWGMSPFHAGVVANINITRKLMHEQINNSDEAPVEGEAVPTETQGCE